MARLELEDFEFRDEGEKVKFVFMKYHHFLVDKSELKKIGKFKVHKDFIEFDASEKTVTNKVNRILRKGMSELVSVLGKPTVYVHRDSGIPLVGTNEFGIVDRDTNVIEVKPHTLCNLDCIYCSVDAGKSSKKTTDFLVEEKYLIDEFRKISSMKKQPVEVSINPQGEPLMYASLVDLVRDLKASESVKIASINTNGILLTKKLVDELAEAGLDRINLSLNTINQESANKLAGSRYPLERVKKIIKYCDGNIEVLIAPLIVPGFNDSEVEDLLNFCLSLKTAPRFGFQNFFTYKRGRNPVKSKSMDWFKTLLRKYEPKHNIKLVYSAEDFGIFEDVKIQKPFKKNDTVSAKVICLGKYPNELIAVSKGRCITVSGEARVGDYINIRIVREKHNIFRGVII